MKELLNPQRSLECVVAIFDDFESAREAVIALNRAGFPRERISLAASDVHEHPEVKEILEFGNDPAKKAAKGAGIGGLVGLLVGGAAMTALGLGPIFVAGYLATTITGAIAGAFLGAMSGWGVNEDHIAEYEELVQQGKTLVAYYGDPLQTAEAERILQRCQPANIRLHAADADESPEVDDRPRQPR